MSHKVAWWGKVIGIRGKMGVHPVFRGQTASKRALACEHGRYSFGTLCPCKEGHKTDPSQKD